MSESPRKLPTILSARFVKYVVGFTVAVGFGLAPFLGLVKVPGYQALLEIFNDPMDQQALFPFSIFLMGVIAVAVQFYSGERISRRAIRRRFAAALAALLVGLFGLFWLHESRVVRKSFSDASVPLVVVLGWAKSDDCPCSSTESTEEILDCLADYGYRPGLCWPGSRGVKRTMKLAYLLLTGGFAALVGILLLQEESIRRKRRRRRGTDKRSS